MISNEEFKRLCQIDNKMLNNIPITEEERKERTRIVLKFKHEVDKAYLKDAKIIE
jgi:hypothetical protein